MSVLVVIGLFVLGLGVWSAATAVLVFAGLITSGHNILSRGGLPGTPAGASLVFAAGLLVLISQALLKLGLQPVSAHWTSFFCLIFLGLPRYTNNSFTKVVETLSPLSRDVASSLLLAVFVFSLRHPWCFPFAVALLACIRMNRPSENRLVRKLLTLILMALSALVAIQLQPDYWWFFYNHRSDMGFFEAISWTTSHWGYNNEPGLFGYTDFKYHWFSYLFMGGLSHLLQLEPFVGLTRLGPLLQTFIFTSALQWLLRLPSNFRQAPLGFGLALLFLVSWPLTRYDSFTFGLAAVLSLSVLIIKQQIEGIGGVIPFIVIGFMTAIAALSKAPSAVAFGGIIATFWLFSRNSKEERPYLGVIGCLAGGMISHLLFLSGATRERVLFTILAKSPAQTLYEALVRTPAPSLLVPLAVLLIANRQSCGWQLQFRTRWLYASVAVAVATSLLFGLLAYADQFSVAANLFLLITFLWNLNEDFRERTQVSEPRLIALLLISSATVLVGLIYPIFINRLGKKHNLSLAIDRWWEIAVLFAPFLLIALTAMTAAALSRAKLIPMIGPFVVFTCLGFVSGINLDNARRHLEYGHQIYLNSESNDPVFAPVDLRSVGRFIRENTQQELVLATNDFCCFGMEWWSRIVDEHRKHPESDFATRWGGDNYLVTAESRRRVLIQGLAFRGISEDGPSDDQIQRMSLSLAFANAPTQKIADGLRDYGVNGFVVNTSLTARRDWSEYAVERYRNGNYIYLELR